ncbi:MULTISPECIES: RagB/SusD family nutrient uptake outer membrane protein [Flavobacteriaceae]|uniref:RagB/SusD family nutrient uptake outer membrane protein n=1 Tax=Flavobacteriaceae TaxID=49546 RepID=UPI0014913C44|nr:MULTISPECIES: RagB/SusD family nutrient uptake outer membrane protein [Allomuricauda]MDC6367614.1 RagB/SusD family nutrient uptake outer membrane protein [Muricauda sp. AC10]
MKFYKYIFLITVVSLGFISCEDELDILPITEKSANSFFSNEAEIESAIAGVYGQLQNGGLYGLDLIGVGEISGEDSFEEIAANDGGRFGQLDDFSTNAGNDLVGDIWEQSYRGIQRANVVLNRITDIEFEDASVKTNRIGEMKFVRALLYFNLVRLYGDVPLVVEETASPFDYFGQGRTPADQVYTQIETDLLDAIQDLPSTKSPARPAEGAARALLADVQLTQGNFTGALTNLETVVNSGEYELMPTTAEVFGVANEGNAEILFEVQFASGFNADGNIEGSPAGSQFRPSGTTANAKGHNLPTQAFIDSFEAGDTRLDDYVAVDPDANPFYFSLKYEVSSTGANDGGSDHLIIRYADVLLKYAEALNENGRTGDAITQLNAVRARAGLGATSATSEEEVRTAIRQERRFELMGEGHRWFDLKRYGTAIEVMNAFFESTGATTRIDQNNLLLPVPQSQIDTDPDFIIQNPGY